MAGAVEIDGIDASALDVRIEDDAPVVVVAESDDVADELLRFDARERSVEIAGVADVDRIDPGHPRVHHERVELFAVETVRTHLSINTNGLLNMKQRSNSIKDPLDVVDVVDVGTWP